MLIRAIDDIVENCTLDNGLFYYKELPSLSRNGNNTLLLESLAIAYELTGDKKYLEYVSKHLKLILITQAGQELVLKRL